MRADEKDFLFGLLFVGWWFFILKYLSGFTGWSRLGNEFEFKGKFSGRMFRCQSVGSRGATHVGMNKDGLYLAVLFAFRPFHKPLFIPWKRIKFIRGKQWFISGYYLTVEGYAEIKFFLPNKTFKRLADYIPNDSKSDSVEIATGK